MRVLRPLILFPFVVLLVLVLVVVVLLGSITARGLPQVGGSLQVRGLHSQVSVVRDRAGIAQIYADDSHDLFMAQGYVHAQDRLWQMEVWRHIGAGRLSELFGESTLDTDRFIRTLDWRGAAERDYEAASDDVKAAMEAYADGVTAYIESHAGQLGLAFVVTGLQSGEGGLGGYTPEPWTPIDSMTWQKVQAWNLGGNMDLEIFRMLADARLGDPARTDELFPAYDPSRPVITPSGLAGSGGAGATITPTAAAGTGTTLASAGPTPAQAAGWRNLAGLGDSIGRLAGLDRGGGLADRHGIGSNNLVVAGSLSATGTPLLANDPHLGFDMPSVWYMNGLHCRVVNAACPFDVVGVSFPGAPAVVLGHNARIAWGATNVGPDVQDLFAEKVDPNDPDAYLYKGESKKFETRKETINVAGSDPVTITVRSSVHGPILNDVDDRLADAPPTALSWTTLLEPDGALESLFRLNTASSFDEFRAAFEVWGAPSQNFVYADVDGHVGYQLPGKIPIRDGAPNGDRIRNGTGLEDWTGWIPFEDLPWQLDPPNGLIVSANNAAVDDAYPYFISDDWDRGERAQRILDLLTLAAKDGVTTAEISAIQNDTHLLRADGIIPGLLELAKPATDDGRRLKDSIASWNRRCDIDSRGCAAYVSVELALVRKAFDDELGPLARDWVGSDTSGQLLQKLIAEPGNAWWDDITTDGVENGRTVSAAAFDAVGADLRATLGDQSRWTWGRLHTVTFRESTLGGSGIGPLEWYFNSATKPAPGAAGAIDNNYYQIWRGYPDPDDSESRGVGLADIFEVSNGPSYRFVVDMANLDGATIVITTGQSGNPFDRHYGDLIDEWLLGETVPLPFSGVAVQNATASTLALTP